MACIYFLEYTYNKRYFIHSVIHSVTLYGATIKTSVLDYVSNMLCINCAKGY